jgi:hypothetical protein
VVVLLLVQQQRVCSAATEVLLRARLLLPPLVQAATSCRGASDGDAHVWLAVRGAAARPSPCCGGLSAHAATAALVMVSSAAVPVAQHMQRAAVPLVAASALISWRCAAAPAFAHLPPAQPVPGRSRRELPCPAACLLCLLLCWRLLEEVDAAAATA